MGPTHERNGKENNEPNYGTNQIDELYLGRMLHERKANIQRNYSPSINIWRRHLVLTTVNARSQKTGGRQNGTNLK